MRLQKQLSRKVGSKEYPKWVITIPPKQIETLGWSEGEFLESEINGKELLIRSENPRRVEKRREAARKAWNKRKAKKGEP